MTRGLLIGLCFFILTALFAGNDPVSLSSSFNHSGVDDISFRLQSSKVLVIAANSSRGLEVPSRLVNELEFKGQDEAGNDRTLKASSSFIGRTGPLEASRCYAKIAPLPAYTVVLDTLLALYTPDLPDNDYLAISRQPTGYYVGVHREGDVYPKEFLPFWLEGDTGPRQLPFPARPPASLPHYGTETVGYWKAPQFDRHLYYGYPDFTVDVFRQLDKQANLSVQEQQWLGRAHAEHSVNLLSNQYGTSAPEHRFKLNEEAYEKLNPAQLTTYLNHLKKAISLYANLPARTETPVGDASTKFGHQVMAAYLTLLQYADKEDALAILQHFELERGKNQGFGPTRLTEKDQNRTNGPVRSAQIAYDPHLLFCSRLFLESCPQNAILITEGDNDTYPLLYLQAVENFRTDILVVNRHLLHRARYVNMLRQGLQTGGVLQLSQPDEIVQKWTKDKFLPGPRHVLIRPEEVPDILSRLSDIPLTASDPVARLPFGAIQFSSFEDGPVFRPEAPVFGLGNLVMLDLIATNFDRRPISLAVTINQNYFAYYSHWQQIGLVYNLGDEKQSFPVDLNGTIAWSALLRQSQPLAYIGTQSRFYLKHLEKLITTTARYLNTSGESLTATELINNYLTHAERDLIFDHHHHTRLLPMMHDLNFDPALISAYVGMVRESLLNLPEEDRPEDYLQRMRHLQFYLFEGEFMNARNRAKWDPNYKD